ncbi:MAG: DUF2007 domain-containing protein [Pseudomonadota bacterium]
MHEILKTTDVVLISHVKSIFGESDIDVLELDEHMSVLEGSIGFLIPRRLMVPEDQLVRAIHVLKSCNLYDKISPEALSWVR